MIRFLIKGVLRDRDRSLLPVMVVALGVMFTVFLYCYLNGILGDMINFNAKYSSGHLKVVTRSYDENMDIRPIDLSLTGTSGIISEHRTDYPNVKWVERIEFGGLVDVPDKNGETRVQGPASGLALDLLTPGTDEIDRLDLVKALRKGKLPSKPGEILLSDQFADNLGVKPGDGITYIGTTMYGGMTIVNFTLSGTISFGIAPLDKGAIITDIGDARMALDMADASSEILGFIDDNYYDDEAATSIAASFNNSHKELTGAFDPVMLSLRDQNSMSQMIDLMSMMRALVSFIFILTLSIILWNTGLIGGLRRYGEVGIRLAVGELKGHIYRSMILESIMIGVIGSVIGTAIGLGFAYWMQESGLDISKMMSNSTMIMPGVFHARITPVAFYIGFIPGIISTVIGTSLSGIGIYRRQTASLFKELQA